MKYDVNYLNNDLEYTFFNSENIPQYLFISVIVALLLDSQPVEEIIGNLKILQREKFLNLSKRLFILKIELFMISAIQTLYILVGNSVLKSSMFLSHWLILFSNHASQTY